MSSRFWTKTQGFPIFGMRSKYRPFGARASRYRSWFARIYERCIGKPARTGEDASGIRVRRNAGDWVHGRLRHAEVVVVAALSGTLGSGTAVALVGIAGWRSATLTVLCLAIGAVLMVHRHQRGTVTNLRKGVAAERHVGGVIEYALTSPGCAIAHSVTGVADVGDIDHLVATPGTLWVVETKYRRVPGDRFPKVVRRIVANVDAVRRWSGLGIAVRGCLVLAVEEEMPNKRIYENGKVEVFDPNSLGRQIFGESANEANEEDLLIARRVWALAGKRLI